MDDTNGSEARDGDVPTWTDLFERGATGGIDEGAVREALSRRRESADD